MNSIAKSAKAAKEKSKKLSEDNQSLTETIEQLKGDLNGQLECFEWLWVFNRGFQSRYSSPADYSSKPIEKRARRRARLQAIESRPEAR